MRLVSAPWPAQEETNPSGVVGSDSLLFSRTHPPHLTNMSHVVFSAVSQSAVDFCLPAPQQVARDKIGRFVRPPLRYRIQASSGGRPPRFLFLFQALAGTLFVLSLLRGMPLCHAKFPTAAKF